MASVWIADRGKKSGRTDRYRVMWRDKPAADGKRAQRTYGYYPTLALARDAKRACAAELDAGALAPADSTSVTLREWAERCYASWALKPKTMATHRYALDKYVLPELGHIHVRVLDTLTVQTWVRQLEDAGYAPNTVRNAYVPQIGRASCRERVWNAGRGA